LLAGISYLPVSGISLLNATVAEHWFYVPSAFLLLAACLTVITFLQNLWERGCHIIPRFIATVAVLWMIFLAARTFIRTFDWKDQRTFLERNIASGGDSARMLINLGSLELNEGKSADAAVHLHAALQKAPDQPLAVINLGAAALKENDFKLARELLTRATQMPSVD